MSPLRATTFPEAAVRTRARIGAAAAFADSAEYGRALFGASPAGSHADWLEGLRLVPPVFVPHRLDKLIELGREPTFGDVDLTTTIGGLRSTLPLYLSAFGSTRVASVDLGLAASRQAGSLGIPMVVGENVLRVNGYGRVEDEDAEGSMLARISAYADVVLDGYGGVVVQQSTEDADAEVWNMVYSDPSAHQLLESGRLAFELKVGQGAKPGLGGMTLLDPASAARLADSFTMVPVGAAVGATSTQNGVAGGGVAENNRTVLRCCSPGTFTEEILRQQIRLMRNNFPRARVWVKLPPARDVRAAAVVAWQAGADAVTVDGAEGGTGWAPTAFLEHVGLPLGECLRRIGTPEGCLLVSGRMWEGSRVAKSLALGASAAGLGRAALIAADTDPVCGLVNLVECLTLELRMLLSALGKYGVAALSGEDVWSPDSAGQPW
ncbi:glutamate synthase-related protein [Jatrophihabitans sp.]|uniref:glutamate synthase-related protein n=1 Tax=Jatrophihabitans sp. TaxID=1932789 RepID=UPI002EE1C412